MLAAPARRTREPVERARRSHGRALMITPSVRAARSISPSLEAEELAEHVVVVLAEARRAALDRPVGLATGARAGRRRGRRPSRGGATVGPQSPRRWCRGRGRCAPPVAATARGGHPGGRRASAATANVVALRASTAAIEPSSSSSCCEPPGAAWRSAGRAPTARRSTSARRRPVVVVAARDRHPLVVAAPPGRCRAAPWRGVLAAVASRASPGRRSGRPFTV